MKIINKYNIIFILLFQLTAQASYSNTECYQLKEKFDKDPKGLSRWYNSSGKILNSTCYFYLGECYYTYLSDKKVHKNIANRKAEYLSKAKIFLESATTGMGASDANTEECYRMLIELEFLSTHPDLNKISEYTNRVPILKFFAEQQRIIKHELCSQTPNLQKIYKVLKASNIRLNDEDKSMLIPFIENILIPYISIFTVMDYPPEYVIELYRTLSPEPASRINKLNNIHRFKKNYLTLKRRLEQKNSQNKVKDLNTIIQSLKTHKTMAGIQPYISAYTTWLKALQSIQHLPQDAKSRCASCKNLHEEFVTLRNKKIVDQIPHHILCCKAWSCLASRHQLQYILPVYNDPQRQQKMQLCQNWIFAYASTKKDCGTDYLIEDKSTVLKKLLQLYQAINAYHDSSSINGITNIHTNTQYEEIKSITGQYLANHYYRIVFEKLQSGRENHIDPFQTLQTIGKSLDRFNRYSSYRNETLSLNISQQHGLLIDFFKNIPSNLSAAKKKLELINDDLKNVWDVQGALDRAVEQAEHHKTQQATERAAEERKTQQEPQKPAQSDDINPAQNAREAFDSFEYFIAWKYYVEAYPGVVPNKLQELVNQSEDSYRNAVNIWDLINEKDRIRLKILSLIINLISSQSTTSFSNIVENRSDYPDTFSFHLAERSHLLSEKSSDRDFINALFYIITASLQNHYPYPLEVLKHLLIAYKSLEQAGDNFSLVTMSRIAKKRKRLLYWIGKVWNHYDQARKDLFMHQYKNVYPSLLNSQLLHNTVAIDSVNSKKIKKKPSSRTDLQSDLNKNQTTFGIESSQTQAQKAKDLFDSFEYFQAWQLFSEVYPAVVPNRLDDLVNQNETTYSPGRNIWSLIDSNDRTRLKILSLIIKMLDYQDIPTDDLNKLIANRSGYSEEFSFHLAERGHLLIEKRSDIEFIKALYYMKYANAENPDSRASYEMFSHFLFAYKALEKGSSEFSLSAQQRITKKRKRLAYWTKKIWDQYDQGWKERVRKRYYHIYPSIFNIFLRIE